MSGLNFKPWLNNPATETGKYGNCPGILYDNDGMGWDYNQTGRFDNATELVSYVCDASKFFRFTTYEPVCEFPWINSGWGNHNQSGWDDVLIDDCSITYAQAVGSKVREIYRDI